MHDTPRRTPPAGLWLAAALGLTLPGLAGAQDPVPPTPPPVDPLAGVPVQVLDRQQITTGTHVVTYNRLAPPVFAPAAPPPTPPAKPNAQAATRASRTRKATRSSRTSDAGDGQKPLRVLFLSATVYDRRFTALRWLDGGSPELRVYADLDFNYFAGVSQIETADAVYLLCFGLGNDTVDSLVQAGQTPPDLAAFPAGYSAYQIVAGDAAAHAGDLTALDALCAYYDANQAPLIASYHQQQADNAARQQWLRDHPPVLPDTVINYWPVKGSVYLAPTP